MRFAIALGMISFLLCLTACTNDTADFELAKTSHTAKAYRDFLQKHPKGNHAQRARQLLDSLTVISGGCVETDSSLAPELIPKFNEIKKLIAQERDMQALARLNEYLKQDDSLKFNARPQIQEILAAVCRKQKIHMDKKGEAGTNNLLDYFTFDSTKYPIFSYEASLCRELQFLCMQAQRESLPGPEAISKAYFQGHVDFNRMLEMVQVIAFQHKVLSSAISAVAQRGLRDLKERPLDVCARKRYWEYAERLLGGGPYWPRGGIEGSEEAVAVLREAHQRERHEAVLAVADKVMARLTPADTTHADSTVAKTP